ncbi:MAG: hypothetical protein GY822_15580 [Deltaproteobacteria bacterium]|nr:hypothetical protein [Deltaproteobacteria bacterium]
MLRMKPFELVHAHSAEEAISLSDVEGEVRFMAGGTDLLVNIKHELHEPVRVVHLGRAKDLHGIRFDDDVVELGALVSLEELATNEEIRAFAPSLDVAALSIAGPQHRRMGTLGGNLCLDTRCLYYNQTYFWRESMGFCLKKDGMQCHVVTAGKKCVAAASNDAATLLLTLDTEVVLRGKNGVRTLPLEKFYKPDGVKNNILESGELVEKVLVRRRKGRVAGFAKLRHREAIDYPLLSVACSLDVEDGKVTAAKLVVSALGARPKSLKTDALVGSPAGDEGAINTLAQLAKKKCAPMTNLSDDVSWRKAMVSVYVTKAVTNALQQLGA